MTFFSPSVLWGYVVKASLTSLTFCLVIVPIIVIYQIVQDSKIFSRQSTRLEACFRHLQFSPRILLPLSAGLILGLLYGAGIILAASREKALSSKDIIILSTFLSVCHAVIEDTILFVVIGANALWILSSRLVIAIAVTFLVGYLYRKNLSSS